MKKDACVDYLLVSVAICVTPYVIRLGVFQHRRRATRFSQDGLAYLGPFSRFGVAESPLFFTARFTVPYPTNAHISTPRSSQNKKISTPTGLDCVFISLFVVGNSL